MQPRFMETVKLSNKGKYLNELTEDKQPICHGNKYPPLISCLQWKEAAEQRDYSSGRRSAVLQQGKGKSSTSTTPELPFYTARVPGSRWPGRASTVRVGERAHERQPAAT